MDIGAAKKTLRREILRRRAAYDPAVIAMRSRLCQANLLESPLWRKARAVALYAAIRGEADTALLLDAALKTGKKLFLPRITDAARGEMRLAPCLALAKLTPGIWNIPEPEPGPEPESLDLIVMPGLAFDNSGRRLGYGGGYYDRYLARRPDLAPCRAGLCLSFQIVPRVPADKWDACVDSICSERSLQSTPAPEAEAPLRRNRWT
ncbi:MAG: 5-formyltetrahydrofolate cyclo-ligase [Desulfovibrio sp.]|nr:5-formyltetrahydrofolate cyclo-ligase [Desulfovibrio sp.]